LESKNSMSVEHLTQRAKVVSGITPAAGAAGLTLVNGAIVDMAGYEGICMVFTFGAITALAVTSIKAQRGNDPALSDAADIAGSGQSVPDNADDQIFIIDLYRPAERYVRGVCSRGTANAVVSCIYFLYGGHENPPAAHGSGVSIERHTDSGEGVA
jgi:hypothetical protein